MKYRVFKSENYQEIQNKYHTPPLISKILDSKNLEDNDIQSILNPRLIYHDFSLFLEAEMTLERIEEAIENNEKICIYGDYDCDGILATSILVQAFLKRGIKVGYHIPHRYEDGYGLNIKRVEQMADKGYSLIITVDNGIKAFDAIERANELGVDVIVTDHHSFEDDLPDAYSIIHTKISPDYPFKEISGGFIAYKLATALNNNKHDKYLFSLAAVTTISDMMPLLDENRAIVKRALEFMNQNKYPALELLLGNTQGYNAQTIGFVIAPKINSFGRLPEYIHPNKLVQYFIEGCEKSYLMKIADSANKINAQRQNMTNEQYQNILQYKSDHFLYYGDDSLHEGIIGLIAGKYTREYELPSFVMHYDQDKQLYKGSARSVEGFSISKFFNENQQYFEVYGGHEMAGGFSIKKENYDLLKEKLNILLKDKILESYSDVILIDEKDISLNQVEALNMLEPFGMKNESPLFYLKNIPISRIYTLSEGKHLKIDINFNHVKFSALAFHKGNLIDELSHQNTIDLVGTLGINEYRNIKNIQLIIKDINPVL
jgi:single-stranded-DNA-specific exonuclease